MTRQKNGVWKLTDDDMNFISIALTEAAEHMAEKKAPGFAKTMEAMADEIFQMLMDGGFYEEIAETA